MSKRKFLSRLSIGLIAVGLLLSIFSGAVNCSSKQQDTETKITLFHVNDAHSRIDQFAKIAWLVNEEKKKNPNVFFLNAGDNFSGNPIVDQYEPKGQPMRKILNMAGTDVLSLGNHEFDYGQELLKVFMEGANFPILCANITVSPEAIIPQPKPYVILETKDGIKIAVIGLVEVSKRRKIPSTHPANLQGVSFTYGVDTAKKYRDLKKKSNVFLALSHLGYETDEELANEMGELDIIIGGHSHTFLEKPVRVNNVMITQTGAYATYLGRVDITLKGGKIINKQAAMIKVSTIEKEDPGIKEKIAIYNNNPRLNQVIATLPGRIKGRPVLGNLVTDAIRKVHHIDIGFHNWGGTRSNRLEKEVRLKDIYTLLPFGNDIIQIEMTPAEIENLVRYDFTRHDKLDLFVSGISYTVRYTGEKNVKEIVIRDIKGNPLDESRTYKVGINDYIVSAYEFDHQDPGKSLKTSVADSLIRYLKQGTDVTKGINTRRTRTEILQNQ